MAYITKTIDIEDYECEFELNEEEIAVAAHEFVDCWVDYFEHGDVFDATGIEQFSNPSSPGWRDNSTWFDNWLIQNFGNENRKAEDVSEVVHGWVSDWAEANGFERPEKSHDDDDWFADFVTQFMVEPTKHYAVEFTVTDTIAVEAHSKEEALQIAHDTKMIAVPNRMAQWIGDEADCVASTAKFTEAYED